MNVYPLIFSNKPKYRITRHVLFWLTWILYFTIFMTLILDGKISILEKFRCILAGGDVSHATGYHFLLSCHLFFDSTISFQRQVYTNGDLVAFL